MPRLIIGVNCPIHGRFNLADLNCSKMRIRNDFRRFSTFRDGSHQNWQPLLHYLNHRALGLGDLLLDFLADLLLARGDALFFFPLLGSTFFPLLGSAFFPMLGSGFFPLLGSALFSLLGSAFIPEELGGDLSAPLVAGSVTSLVAFETEDCFSGEEGDA